MILIKKLLESVKLDDSDEITPQPQRKPQQTEQPTRKAPPLTMPRKKAENIAANILHYEQYKGNPTLKAHEMTNEEIAELIARFRADALGEE